MHFICTMYKTLAALTLALAFGVVLNNPFCYNWCPGYIGYACCDQQYYPNYRNYPQYPIFSPAYPLLCCPTIEDCSRFNRTHNLTKHCDNDNQCGRTQLCCGNPCQNGDKMCFNGTDTPDHQSPACPEIKSCEVWKKKNESTGPCDSHAECVRSQSCCNNPCVGHKTCQKSKIICC